MHSNNDKKGYETDREKAPGGGPIIHKDPSKYDAYSGNNPRMYKPYKPDTKMQSTSSQGSGYKRQ